MRGSVSKRCQCRTADGRRVKNCRKQHGSWSYTVDAGTDSTTGKRRQITRSGFRTKDFAEEALTAELTKLNTGTWTDDQRMTLGKWLDQWLAEMVAGGRSVNTIKNYRGHVRDAWKPYLATFYFETFAAVRSSPFSLPCLHRSTGTVRPATSGVESKSDPPQPLTDIAVPSGPLSRRLNGES